MPSKGPLSLSLCLSRSFSACLASASARLVFSLCLASSSASAFLCSARPSAFLASSPPSAPYASLALPTALSIATSFPRGSVGLDTREGRDGYTRGSPRTHGTGFLDSLTHGLLRTPSVRTSPFPPSTHTWVNRATRRTVQE